MLRQKQIDDSISGYVVNIWNKENERVKYINVNKATLELLNLQN